MRPRARSFVVAVAVLLAATGAAACGGSNGDSPHASGVHVVKIGVIAPLNRGAIDAGRAIRNSVQLAVSDANARLAIAGWSIELVAKDDSSDPATGERAAASLVADPSVIGVVGTYDSAVAWRVAPVLDRAGVAMVSPANTDPALTIGPDATKPQRQFDTYFRLIASNAQQGPFLARYARNQLHAQMAAVVSDSQPANRTLASGFATAFRAAGGKVVLDRTVPDRTTRVREVGDTIDRLAPDVIVFGGEDASAAALRAATTSSAPLLGGDGVKDDAYLRAAGVRAEGDIAATAGVPLDAKSSAIYRLAYTQARFAEPPTDFGPYAYDAANVIIGAAATALLTHPSITPAVRTEIVANVQATRTSGATGAIAFDAFGDAVGSEFTVYQVQNGAWRPVFTARSG